MLRDLRESWEIAEKVLRETRENSLKIWARKIKIECECSRQNFPWNRRTKITTPWAPARAKKFPLCLLCTEIWGPWYSVVSPSPGVSRVMPSPGVITQGRWVGGDTPLARGGRGGGRDTTCRVTRGWGGPCKCTDIQGVQRIKKIYILYA